VTRRAGYRADDETPQVRLTGAGITIRRATGDDYDGWLALWAGYNAFYGRKDATALPEALNRLTWERLQSSSEPMHLLVASEEEELLGFAHLIFHQTTISPNPTCYLQDLFVAPEARRRGIAEQLIKAGAAEARSAGAAKLYWQTHQSNSAARHLYDRLAEHRGFIVYDVRL